MTKNAYIGIAYKYFGYSIKSVRTRYGKSHVCSMQFSVSGKISSSSKNSIIALLQQCALYSQDFVCGKLHWTDMKISNLVRGLNTDPHRSGIFKSNVFAMVDGKILTVPCACMQKG